MAEKNESEFDANRPAIYQIGLKGSLGDGWAEWLDGLNITLDGQGNSLLCGPVADQAALYGLLRKIRDSGLTLLSVNRVEAR